MNKLIINLSKENNLKESVPKAVLDKLYNLGKTDDSNHTFTYGVNTSNVKRPITTVVGAIIVPVAYMGQLDYVRNKYPNLDVTATAVYIDFEDSNMESALLALGIGDGTGITAAQAANITFSANTFKDNTSITKFNEYRYFTQANLSLNSLVGLFLGATNLSEIDLSQLVIIHANLFRNSGIKNANAPLLSTLGILGGSAAFYECTNLETAVVSSLTTIPVTFFYRCTKLRNVTISEDCTEIGQDAFKGCTLLTYLSGNLGNIRVFNISCFDGCNNLILDLSNYNKVTSIKSNAFLSCYNVTGTINMPNYSDPIFLGFNGSKISKILCIGTASTILHCKAQNTSNARLEEVYLPYECTIIGDNAFYDLVLLETVKQYDKTVTEFVEGETPTYFSNLSKITKFGNHSFRNCLLMVFTNADLLNATYIGEDAFLGTKLLGNITLNSNLSTLGKEAFDLTLITSLDLSNTSITKINGNLCLRCTNLLSVYFPNSCKLLEGGAFSSCSNLETISGLSGEITIKSDVFYNCSRLQSFFNGVSFILSGTKIFMGCSLLTSITLAQINQTIGQLTFDGCTSLTTINNSEYITSISGDNAFYNCEALLSLNLDEDIIEWSDNIAAAFKYCSALTTLGKTNFNIKGVTILGFGIFYGCSSLEGSLNFPDVIETKPTNYGAQFNGCSKLVKISFPKILLLRGGSAYLLDTRAIFGNCTSLKIVDLGNLITRLDPCNFYKCNNLRAVLINTSTPPKNNGDSYSSNTINLMFGNNTVNIYVPDAAVDTYKSTLPYSNFPDNIKPISQYNESSILGS